MTRLDDARPDEDEASSDVGPTEPSVFDVDGRGWSVTDRSDGRSWDVYRGGGQQWQGPPVWIGAITVTMRGYRATDAEGQQYGDFTTLDEAAYPLAQDVPALLKGDSPAAATPLGAEPTTTTTTTSARRARPARLLTLGVLLGAAGVLALRRTAHHR